jgi:hypothetical protein
MAFSHMATNRLMGYPAQINASAFDDAEQSCFAPGRVLSPDERMRPSQAANSASFAGGCSVTDRGYGGNTGHLALLTPLVDYKLDSVEAARRDL